MSSAPDQGTGTPAGQSVDTSPGNGRTDTLRAVDEVDRVVEAWHRVRPDLDVEPLSIFSRISRLARHLDLVRRSAFAGHRLESWEFDVLTALRRAGEPYQLSPGALLTQTLVTSGTMTNRIDRLEERGLVVRRRSPDDRRGVLVEITPEGLDQVDGAMSDLLRVEAERLEALDSEARTELARLLRRLAVQFES